MAQGVLPFQYEAETCTAGLTGFAGLGVYLDLIEISGLAAAVRKTIMNPLGFNANGVLKLFLSGNRGSLGPLTFLGFGLNISHTCCIRLVLPE